MATELDDLDGLLPSFPGMGEVAEELEEHPLTKACAAEDLWVEDLPLSSSPDRRAARHSVTSCCLLSGTSWASEGNLLGLSLKMSSSFADLINETLINETLCFA